MEVSLTAADPSAAGKLRQLPDGLWYVHCKWCDQEAHLQARNEEEAYGMLNVEWRLSMPGKKYEKRNWSCPRCAEHFKGTTPTAMDTAESAGQLAAAATALSFDDLNSEVKQLKAKIEELKADVENWKELAPQHMAYKAAHVDESES
ncbi:hypothetical protein N9L68_08775 [bacterium]|nr:hypothetical protein [bacterium]